MERKMLINTTHSEECRIAIVEDNNLVELEVESTIGRKLKGNIYKARVSRIEPSLQAAFIDIGATRNGFLQINDIHPGVCQSNRGGYRGNGQPGIQDLLYAGQEIIVQVVKEEREMKGATLTTYLSLPGRYVVLMPGSDRGGVSRKISDGEQRNRLKVLSREMELPAGMGMIIRTAGLDRSLTDLSRDASLQLKLWEKIIQDAQTAPSPTVLYEENDVATRVVRDYFTPEIRQILIDHPDTFRRVREFVDEVMPRYRSRVQLYDGVQPLFSAFGIEEQISASHQSEVQLPSGGSLVIEQLEALVAIDVNSGKATSQANIEETAYRTNIEAADEIAKQLKIRDLGGLIVIDFIDMGEQRHISGVEKRLATAVKDDKAKVEVGRISRFGLLEMSRQRLRASLQSQSFTKCNSCRGTGFIRNAESVALEALRKVHSICASGNISVVKARLSSNAALFLLNMKKQSLVDLERRHGVKVFILPDGRLRSEEYELEIERPKSKAEEAAGEIQSSINGEVSGHVSGGRNSRRTVDEDYNRNQGGRHGRQKQTHNRGGGTNRPRRPRLKPRNLRRGPSAPSTQNE